MTLLHSIEGRRPPINSLSLGGDIRGRLLKTIQLFVDLQVATVRRDIAPWLSSRRGSLLEVGCGDQPYRTLVPRCCTYVGIDRADMNVAFEMQRTRGVITYRGETFPVADNAFDSLFHTEVLEHTRDPKAFLVECRRVLKQGGEMFLTVPFQARYHFIPHDYFRFTPSALRMLLEASGFDSIDVRARGSDITVAAYKVAAVGFRWAYSGWRGRTLSLLTTPLTAVALLIAHASLVLHSGCADDCLGFTVTARAKEPKS